MNSTSHLCCHHGLITTVTDLILFSFNVYFCRQQRAIEAGFVKCFRLTSALSRDLCSSLPDSISVKYGYGSRHEFCVSRVTRQKFMLSHFSKIEVVQEVTKFLALNLPKVSMRSRLGQSWTPRLKRLFCKTEYFAFTSVRTWSQSWPDASHESCTCKLKQNWMQAGNTAKGWFIWG